MANEPIKHTYREVEIVYVESGNVWNFIANGRERNVESLTKAKETIDRSLDYERKERPWKPFAAYFHRSTSEGFMPVTVTSQAEQRYGSGAYYWITSENEGKKSRHKEHESYLYATTPENEAAIARWQELDVQIEALAKEQQGLVKHMAKAQPAE